MHQRSLIASAICFALSFTPRVEACYSGGENGVRAGKPIEAYELLALTAVPAPWAEIQPILERDPLLMVAMLDVVDEGRCQINHPEEIQTQEADDGVFPWSEVTDRVDVRAVHSLFDRELADDELSFADLQAVAAVDPFQAFAKLVEAAPSVDWLVFREQVTADPYFAFLAHAAVAGVVEPKVYDGLIVSDPFVALASLRVGLQVADLVSRARPDLESAHDLTKVAALVEQEPLAGLGYLRLAVMVADADSVNAAAAEHPVGTFVSLALAQRVYSFGTGLWNEGDGIAVHVDDGGRIGFVGLHDVGSWTGRTAGDVADIDGVVSGEPWAGLGVSGPVIGDVATLIGPAGSGIGDLDGVADIDGLAAQFVTRDGIHPADGELSWSEAYELSVSEPLLGLALLMEDVGAALEGATGVRCVE
ncbi:MAG: hypothetical protein AAF533_09490 [Acidobacteriota bacterium]